ncbi:MAG: ATP-binding protein [Bacteroidales bacterium]|nr:ATP-binding protein [Bacteroidales bacterium]MDD3431083.1 ATP-binding protein [Bacteroidales bacterium]MDD4361751.1 ATP-binding protein [Bacteroidales bacterium]MDD4430242.1 ATP-binding protein [Bacteroidales bacterium]
MSFPDPAQKLIKTLDLRLKQAIDKYSLIQDDDQVLIGLSGGKDSLALVELLGRRMKIFRPRFRAIAVHVVMKNIPYQGDIRLLEQHCREFGLPFLLRETQFDASSDKRKSPCFLCSWHRRKLLFETAKSEACNKIALGHHRDDILESLLMNMFFQGSIQSMPPLLRMDKFEQTLIRPLCLISEQELEQWAELRQYPSLLKQCPYEKSSYRPEIRKLIQSMEKLNPQARNSLWASMQHIYPDYLP